MNHSIAFTFQPLTAPTGGNAPVIGTPTAGATATNTIFNGSQDWTITFPSGVSTPSSGAPFILQVNNANSLDPNKERHYVNPIAMAIRSTSDVNRGDQASASASDFEGNWVDYATIAASAYVGTGNFRFLRIKNTAGFTGTASSFKAYFYSFGMVPIV